jgi:hypothetical protein
MTDEALHRIDVLVQVGMRLARSAKSGRVLLARIAETIDPAWMPSPWGDPIDAELQAARASACEPVAMRQIERALRDAWGRKPTEELDELDPRPVAVTPLSQVHRGVLDGAPVVVKVLRPGLAATVRQDLALLDGLRRPLAAAFPGLDGPAVLHEFRERALEELDLEHAASVQRGFHRALRRHPIFTVPAPYTALCREGVLVSEWIDGVPLRHAADRDAAAALLVVFVFGSARTGTMYAGPDPDDVLVLPDGRVAILGFGSSRTIAPDRLAAATAVLHGFADGDPAALGSALERLGWLPSPHAPAALSLIQQTLSALGDAEPVRLDGEAIVGARTRLLDQPGPLSALILAGAVADADLWPALAVIRLFASIARVGATGPWRELARAALADGWEAVPGGR